MPTPAQIDEQIKLERDQIAQGLKRLHKNTRQLEEKSYGSATVYGITSIDSLLPLVVDKIKEYVYKTDLGAKKRINKIMDEEIDPSNITICDAHRIHYLPFHTANTEEATDDMQDYEDEDPFDLFDEETGYYEA